MSLEVCPVCHGRGVVQNGFYSTTTVNWISTTTGTEICKSCMGKGYIQATVDVDNSTIREQEEMHQRLKRLEELESRLSGKTTRNV